MSPVTPIATSALLGVSPVITQIGPTTSLPATTGQRFGDILAAGIKSVETKVSAADDMVRQFALNDSIPVHQVTYALEQARLSVELAMQVRARLVEGYREMMNMQL